MTAKHAEWEATVFVAVGGAVAVIVFFFVVVPVVAI